MKQYNMVLISRTGAVQLVGQSDDPQWYVEMYHTEGRRIDDVYLQWETNAGVLHALEVNGTFQFTSPFLLSKEDRANVFDVPDTVQKQPIETAPKDGTVIMGYQTNEEDSWERQIKWVDGRWLGSFDGINWYISANPSHWLPYKQPIATAPMDGTTIMGYWEEDPDPRPHEVRYSPVYKQWILVDGEEDGEDTISPTHWTPIN